MPVLELLARGKKRLRREWAFRKNNRQIEAMAKEVARRAQPADGTRPVVFFNASTRLGGVSLNAAYALLAGWSLRLGGTPVVHFVCQGGMSRCVLGTKRSDLKSPPPCKTCVAQSQALYTGAQTRWFTYQPNVELETALTGLGIESMSDFEYQGVPLGAIILPALRWVLRRHHLVDDEDSRSLYRQYILSAWGIYCQFSALLDETQPQCVVVFNGQFYPEATARWTAQQRGLRVISHEVGLQPYSAFFTDGEATAYPIDIPESFELSPAQNARLDTYLEKRFQGNFSMAGVRFWPEMRSLDPAFWQRASAFKQIVPVFTNVIFDTSQGHANTLYPHMFAWMEDVLKIAQEHPETLFVLRAHPDESRPGKESRESVADWVQKNGVEALPNVIFVGADQFFSSYELIQKSKFVMVYNSTIGLEASLLGAAILCAGRARFTQLPTVFFPQSAQQYRQQAEAFLTAETIDIPAEFRRNARRFLYYQLFRTSLPFNDYLQEDGVWRGYVTLKPFGWQALLPGNSIPLKIITDGILENRSFLLDE